MTEEITHCPQCAAKGRKVDRSTLESLLKAPGQARLTAASKFLFCRTPECSTVYFAGGLSAPFRTQDLGVTVFQKSQEPQRWVCYCFEHSVQSIHDEVAETGDSDVAEKIGARCKLGEDRCETENPQGSCCLGNIRQVTKAAKAALGIVQDSALTPEPEAPSCCGGKGA